MTVKSGEIVNLSAEGSTDPDGDQLTYQWIYYREPGSFLGIIKIENETNQKMHFTAPKVNKAETLHIILNVRDTGKPELTRYQRIIVTVEP